MIVVCVCGQKNNVKFPLVAGTTVRCGSCKVGLAETAAVQADRNARLVLAVVEHVAGLREDEWDDTCHELEGIFKKEGMRLDPLEDDDDDDDN